MPQLMTMALTRRETIHLPLSSTIVEVMRILQRHNHQQPLHHRYAHALYLTPDRIAMQEGLVAIHASQR